VDARQVSLRNQSTLLALLAVIVLLALGNGCGDESDRKEALTAADVQEAFARQGLDLAAFQIGPGIPVLAYPTSAAGTQRQRVVCLVFGNSVTGRGYLKTIREKRPSTVSRALRAKNVVVLLGPAATANEVEGTLAAVADLRRS
jgi:hypothetical protein